MTIAVIGALLPTTAAAAIFLVSDTASLNNALAVASAGDTIEFAGSIALTNPLPPVATSVVIDGAGNALDCGYAQQGLSITASAVLVEHLTMTHCVARGGDGGSGSDGSGGGGLGAGGGLFVKTGASVVLLNVAFKTDKAQGGDSGPGGSKTGGGGGGGLNGGTGQTGHGASAGGTGGDGGSGPLFPDSAGPGGPGGGSNGSAGSPGAAATLGGGGGGGGGANAANGAGANGGDGGFGGGGGGGGFGGSSSGSGGAPGLGGGHGGSGLSGEGTGGAAYGGAIFVMAGATLTIVPTADFLYTGNTTANGSGGVPAATAGQDIYIDGASQVVTFEVDAGRSEFGGSPQTTQGSIAGDGGISKAGPGTMVLSSANTYQGPTTVADGTLLVNGTLASSSTTVLSGATLGGTGTIAAITLDNGGVIAPGDGAGTLSAQSLTWNGGGGFAFQLGADDGNSDRLALSGTLTKGSGSGFVFHFSDGAQAPTLGTTYTLMTFASQSGFTLGDFGYDYGGANPALVGNFILNTTSLQFEVTTTPVRLQSFSVD